MASSEVLAKDTNLIPLDFPKNVDVNDALPSEETLAKVARYSLLDVNDKQVLFRSLYEGTNGEKKNHKVLVIFVRHFYCGNCQDYIEYLSKGLPSAAELETLSNPISVIVIGCGAPSLIPFYAETASSAFPIYADPTRQLYSDFKMTESKANGGNVPGYIKSPTIFQAFLRAANQALRRVAYGDALKGGSSDQVGGEFLFQDGKVTWCHRMKNATDHSDLQKIREVLGLTASQKDKEIH